MKSLLIVYHSQSGTCARFAAAVAGGAAREENIAVTVRRAWDAGVSDLAAADGVVLIAAENSGALSGAMKDFLDRCFYPAIQRGLVLPYALVLSAGNDGRGAQRQADRILSGIPFTRATETQILRGEFRDEYAARSEEIGQAFAAGLAMGIF